ncbi:hypothetical protein C2U72_12385, partial [Prosthecomicrobium hirschii]
LGHAQADRRLGGDDGGHRLRMAKEALNRVEFMQTEDGYELEQSFSTRLMTTEDAREATRAVVEKRPPVFVGR